LATAAVLALGVITVAAQISERHEREKAEQLATFIVDLGERLRSDADLETLALISSEATRHLQNLDPDRLLPETGIRVALAFRQMGRVNQFQAKPDEALESFERSRDLLSHLYGKYPENAGLLFELGNAEYYIGNLHVAQNRHDTALGSMETYHRLTHALLERDPDNPDWILELSYSHNNLAAIHLDSGRGVDKQALSNVSEALRLMEIVVAMKPDDRAIAMNYATTLAWAADAQLQACNLEQAVSFRHRVLELSEFSTNADPGNNEFRKQYAYALTGMARMQNLTGDLASAVENLELAVSILQSLYAADPSNLHYRDEALYRQVMLARLVAESGQHHKALAMLQEIEAGFAVMDGLEETGSVPQTEYIEFLLTYTEAELGRGRNEQAKSHLQRVVDLHSGIPEAKGLDIFGLRRMVQIRYLWWQLEGDKSLGSLPMIPPFEQAADAEFRSCGVAASAARMFVIDGQLDNAATEVKYLTDRGYAEPSFVRFCSQHGLCG
jgi:tetratricopeptide (TPR) repeat protein